MKSQKELTFQEQTLFHILKSKFNQNAMKVPIIIIGPRYVGKSFVLDCFFDYLKEKGISVVNEDFSRIIDYDWESFDFHPYYPFALAMKNFIPENHRLRKKLKRLQKENSAPYRDNKTLFSTIPSEISDDQVVIILKNLFNPDIRLPGGNDSDSQNLARYLARSIGNAIISLSAFQSNLILILEYSVEDMDYRSAKNSDPILERLALAEKDRLISSGNLITLNRPTREEIVEFNRKQKWVKESRLTLLLEDNSYPFNFDILKKLKKTKGDETNGN